MPETRLTKARATLPGDYQYGDGRWMLLEVLRSVGHGGAGYSLVKVGHESVTRRERADLVKRAFEHWNTEHWNTIEAEWRV